MGNAVRIDASGGTVLTIRERYRSKNLAPFDERKARHERDSPAEGGARILETAGHDLRGSVSTMLVLGEVLMDEAGSRMSESERGVLSGILSSGEEALRLTADFLDLSTGKAGIMKLSLEPVDLVSAVSQSIELHRPMCDQKGVQMTLFVDRAPPVLMLDWEKMMRALNKLLSHAINDSAAKGALEIRITSSGRFARICVQFQGTEVPPPDFSERLSPFSPIQRDNTQRTSVELERDLIIAKWIVSAHGGRIRISGKAGVAEQHLLTLPLTSAARNPAAPIY